MPDRQKLYRMLAPKLDGLSAEKIVKMSREYEEERFGDDPVGLNRRNQRGLSGLGLGDPPE